jgi:hypothetical protein
MDRDLKFKSITIGRNLDGIMRRWGENAQKVTGKKNNAQTSRFAHYFLPGATGRSPEV